MSPVPPSHPTLLIATRNRHKVDEIRAILGERFDYQTLIDFPEVPPIQEDGLTFEANAAKKSQALAEWLVKNGTLIPRQEVCVLADDSGLEVDALQGAPGVHSARFSALETGAIGNAPDAANNAKLLRLLREVPTGKRTARFRCVIALTLARGSASKGLAHGGFKTELFDGACEGWVDVSPRGQGGFGYDPLFIPDGFDRSFAELGAAEKNKISHRSKALAKLSHWFARSAFSNPTASP